MHLMDEECNMLSYDHFKIKFILDYAYRQFSLVVKAIPVALRNLIKGINNILL